MNKLLIQLFGVISSKRKRQLVILLAIITLNSFAEAITLVSVIPFLIVISNPEKLLGNTFFIKLFNFLGININQDFTFPITLFFIITVIAAGIIRITNLWMSGRISVAIGTDLSFEIYRKLLLQDYSFHLKINSSEIISTLNSFIFQTIAVIKTLLELFTSVLISISIIISLFFINWNVALTSVSLFVFFYLMLALLVRPFLLINSQKVSIACEKQIQLLQDSLGSIRDIILDSNQKTYLDIFREKDRTFRLKAFQSQFIGAFPKFLFEIIGYSILATLAFFLVTRNDAGLLVIPVLGSFALGAQKLLPAFQQLYSGWTYINSSFSELSQVLKMVKMPVKEKSFQIKKYKPIKKIVFDKVSFKYSKKSKNVISDFNFTINSGEIIGLIGLTGSGKSTLVDLLMGLLTPTLGNILVDGENINDNKFPDRINSWRLSISHVPQNIFLTNSTIRENIAFGIEKQFINYEKLEFVAKQAQIYDFIKKSKKGYDLEVGERGCNLSGGQRQRIGIARALYKNSPVLILDEATSALDPNTEKKVLEAIGNFKSNKTIIIISHNPASLKNCDRIFKLEKDSIIENF